MIKAISLVACAVSLLTVPQVMPKKIETPPQKPSESTVIVGFLHTTNNLDPNYTIEGNDLTIHDKLNNDNQPFAKIAPKTDNNDINTPNEDIKNNNGTENNDNKDFHNRRRHKDLKDRDRSGNPQQRTFDIQGDMTPDEQYNMLKTKLDERFSYMFELKSDLEKQQSETSAKWEEYYILRQAYEKSLKRIIAHWVMTQSLA